jgi:signal peptidase I
LIFIGLALFYLPIAFICVQLIAAFFIRYSSFKTENRKPLIHLMVCMGWCVIWYGFLFFVALNKSWLLGFDLYRVTSSSMEPTLFHGEYVLADTKIKRLNRNDIVFFQYQPIGDQVNVKRVFALAGDSVKIESGKLPAFLMPAHQENGIKIREGEVFVTGDNVK